MSRKIFSRLLIVEVQTLVATTRPGSVKDEMRNNWRPANVQTGGRLSEATEKGENRRTFCVGGAEQRYSLRVVGKSTN